MAIELGHEPSNRDLFLRCCYGSNNVLIDDRAKKTLGASQTIRSSQDQLVIQQGETIKSLQSGLTKMKSRFDMMYEAIMRQSFQLPSKGNSLPEAMSPQVAPQVGRKNPLAFIGFLPCILVL